MKLIFDLDNTLIPIRKEYALVYKEIFKDLGEEEAISISTKVYELIDQYEKIHEKYDKQQLLDFLNENLNMNFDITLIDKIVEIVGNTWYSKEDLKLKELLEYLSSKYELYVLTNWFTESQKKRLENLDLLKYFKKVIGGDMVPLKPNIKAYKDFLDHENCIMIGDNPDVDIKGAEELGMNSILVDRENKYPDYKGVKIKDIFELKEVL